MSRRTATLETPLSVAKADYEAVDRDVKDIEATNAPLEEKFGQLAEAREAARISLGDDSSEVKKADAAIARIHGELTRARQRLDVAKRRRDESSRRIGSEERGILIARESIANQQARVDRQRAALAAARNVVEEKQDALDREESMLSHFRRELAALTGDTDSASGDAVIGGGVENGNDE